MAINNDRNLLEQQILTKSGLQGNALEDLKKRLATLSEQELQAELSKALTGDNKEQWYTGVLLEHNDSVVMLDNYDNATYTDEKGNEISELKDGDEVLERTIKSTDEKGNTFETKVSFANGKPLSQTKSKNGNTIETRTYEYNDYDDSHIVTVMTKKSNNSTTITDVLEIDENGNFDNEDFIDRQTTTIDGTVISIYTENNCVIEKQVKPDGKIVETVYKGDSIEAYDDKKLRRVFQRSELNGKVHEVEYDGDGNTKTVVQNGETPSMIARRFGVKESSLLRLNPAKGKKAITQVGADILVPGEFDADSKAMKARKTKAEAMAEFAKEEASRVATKLYSATIKEVTLDRDYKNAYDYAKSLLLAEGIKNPTNKQLNDKANEILVINGNVKFTKGRKIKIAAKNNSKIITELSNLGFKSTAENAVFFQRFNALNAPQQQCVLSVIKYCKSQNITDQNKIKAKILETYPDINLFDSGKTIPTDNIATPAFKHTNPVSVETFLTETLKLDLKSEVGKTVYERLASLPQEVLNQISTKNFRDLSKSNFTEIAQAFEVNGINIRTREEHQIEYNTPKAIKEREKQALRETAAENIALAYDNAINIIKQYQGNQGWVNIGFYREKLGQLLSKVNPTDISTCFEDVIKQLEKDKIFVTRCLKDKIHNEKEFKATFKKLMGGAEYNEENIIAFLEIAQDKSANFEDEAYNKKFWDAYNKVFGVAKTDKQGNVYYEPQIVKAVTGRVNRQGTIDGLADIAAMLYGTEAIGKGIAWAGGKVMGKISPYIPKVLTSAGSKTVMKIGTNNITVGRVVGNMASQSATFALWDAGKNYVNIKTKDIQYTGEAAEEEMAAYRAGLVESAKFGAFAGAFNTLVVSKVVDSVANTFNKPAAMKAVGKVSKSFEKTPSMTGADVMKVYMKSQGPGALAKTAGTVAEICGFTAYETVNEVAEELLITDENGERHLPEQITEESLGAYLWDKFKGQATNLGEIKAISKLIFMHKGAVKEQERLLNENLAKYETLKNVKIKKTQVNGREIFEVTMPDGNRKVANSIEEVIGNCNVLMQLDMISNAAKENVESEPKSETAKHEGVETGSVGTRQVKVKDFPPKHVARTFGDLPPIKDGYIRLIHRTSSENAEKIVQSGLYGEVGLADTASPCRSEQEFWETLTSPFEVQNAHGDTKVIIDMPIKEFKIFAGGIEYGDLSTTGVRYNFNVIDGEVEEPRFSPDQGVGTLNRLVCPKKYIVGVCKHDRILTENEIQKLKEQTSKNPLQDVEETDLAPYEIFKQKANELYTQNDDWDFDLNFEDNSAKEPIEKNDDWMKGFNIGEKKHTTPQGMNAEKDALIQKARKENPAEVVEDKVREKWQQHDLNTPTPEAEGPAIIIKDGKAVINEELARQQLEEPVKTVSDEVTSLIFRGKLNEHLTQRYEEMGKVFEEIAQKRSADIKDLVKQNPKNKQAVADGIVKILAQELGMQGFEPPIVFEDTKGADGFADWPNGRIVINKNISNAKKLTSMISHEFVHMLQYRDILAQYGEQGMRDLINNDKSIPDNKKESYIKDALGNDYNKHLLQSYNFRTVQEGTVEDYLRRIYKDEFTNTAGTDNMKKYTDQVTEREAYRLGSEKLGEGTEGLNDILTEPSALQERMAQIRSQAKDGEQSSADIKAEQAKSSAQDYEIDEFGQIHRKNLPSGVEKDSQSSNEEVDIITAINEIGRYLPKDSTDSCIIDYIFREQNSESNINKRLLDEVISILKLGVDEYECLSIVNTVVKTRDGKIDNEAIEKFHELVSHGAKPGNAEKLISYCRDENGHIKEDLYNKILSLKEAPSYASRSIIDKCKIDGKIDEGLWQKVLELEALGFNNSNIASIIGACEIKSDSGKPQFNEELFEIGKRLLNEHKFSHENITNILDACHTDIKSAQEYFDRAVYLRGKINESSIYKFVKYPKEILDFVVELKGKYNIEEGDLSKILRNCRDENGKISFDYLKKAEELMSINNINPYEVVDLIRASKVNDKLDSKLFEEVVKLHHAGFEDISWLIDKFTTESPKEDEPPVINYKLLDLAKGWKSLDISETWIDSFASLYNSLKLDSKNDLVKEYHEAGFEPSHIKHLLDANSNLEDISLTEFRDKVLEFKKLGIGNEEIMQALQTIGLPNSWGSSKFKLSKQNLDIVTDMIKQGIRNPGELLKFALDKHHNANQKSINTIYERVKEGIPEERLQNIYQLEKYYEENPELKALLFELGKYASKDCDLDSFRTLNYHILSGTSEHATILAKTSLEAIKKGAKESDIIGILSKRYNNSKLLAKDDADDVILEIKTKLIDALAEQPDKAELIIRLAGGEAREIESRESLAILDFYLKHADKYYDIKPLEHPLNRARYLMLQLDKQGVPIDEILGYTNILCKGQYVTDIFSKNVVDKIVELRNNQQLDNAMLKFISLLPMGEHTAGLIDYIAEHKADNKLPDLDSTAYIIRNLVEIPNKNSASGKEDIYDNYKEIVDFYINNKDLLTAEDTNAASQYFNNTVNISMVFEGYKNQIEGIPKTLDMNVLNSVAKLAQKASVSPIILKKVLDKGYGDKLKTFVDKADLENYSEAINEIFKKIHEQPYYHAEYAEILNENISKRNLEFILDIQKLICDNTPKGEQPQILNIQFVKPFTEGKELSEEALNKIRFYAEAELSENNGNKNLDFYSYLGLLRLYKNNPESIEFIDSIIYDKELDHGVFGFILNDLSSTPEILDKQITLIKNILDYTNSHPSKYSIGNELIGIVRSAKTIEDADIKIEMWEHLKSQLESKSLLKRAWDSKIKDKNDLGMALRCVEGTNSVNKNVVYVALANKKYSDKIWSLVQNINEYNAALIEDIIKNDRLKDPDHAIQAIVINTGTEFKAKFIHENFDKIPQENLHKVTAYLNETNGDLILRLYNDKELNFPKEHILDIARHCDQKNIALVTRLCTDKSLDFPTDKIIDIARALNNCSSKYIDFAERLCTDKSLKCTPDKIVGLINTISIINKNTSNMSLREKINTFATISALDKSLLDLCRKYSNIDIDTKLTELTLALGKKKDTVKIPSEQQKLFVQNILSNNNKDAEQVLKTFDFEQFGKEGLPVKYTREEFTNNVENLINNLSIEEQALILDHFGLIRGAAGFDGLPNNKPFDNAEASAAAKEVARKIQIEIENFTTKNEIRTGDENVDNVLNGLIQGLPEFTSIVGKVQHGTHAYSVDIHSLKVLQSAMNNPLYEKLNDRDKTILKFTAICHDFGKRGGVVDSGHASASAEYVTAILDKFAFPKGMKDRIIDIVENHHWFEAYNTGNATAEDIAVRCRRPQDFIIYEILSKADFENVNPSFHIERSEGVSNQAEFDDYMQNKMEAIDEALQVIYSRANLVFDTQFVQNGDMFPRETLKIDGEPVEFKVLDLNKLGDNASLTQYGFSPGVTKKSARFTVHMTHPEFARMESVMILTQNSLNQSAWSTSLIKASNNRTYCNEKFGFIFDVDEANISEAYFENLGSGTQKQLSNYKNILFNSSNEARTYVRDNLLAELNKKGIKLDDAEYAQLSRQLIPIKYTTQITKDIKIGSKIIKAADLVTCLDKSRDKLFNGGDIHSEIVSLNPRVKGLIAKVNTLLECPEEFLRFAQTHNLPIILMKPAQKE